MTTALRAYPRALRADEPAPIVYSTFVPYGDPGSYRAGLPSLRNELRM